MHSKRKQLRALKYRDHLKKNKKDAYVKKLLKKKEG